MIGHSSAAWAPVAAEPSPEKRDPMTGQVPKQLFPLCGVFLWALFLPGTLRGDDIVLGMSAAFKGPSRGLSIELYRGSLAYFEQVNKMGGVHGNTIHIKAYDDGYNPKEAIDNTIRLVEKDEVFLLFDYMGTPTVTRILPLLKKYENRSIYLLCPFTGAEPQRRYPYNELVFNLRASYHQETAQLVDQFLKIGRKRIAVFYQIDAYGRNGWEGVRRRLAWHSLDMLAEATYQRGSLYSASFKPQVDFLRQANPDAIISIGTYSACAGFIRDARDAGWTDIPIANISGVDSDNLLKLLVEEGKTKGKDYTVNLLNSQVVPSYHDTTLPAVQEYRQLMDLHKPLPPPELLDEAYDAPTLSFNSFEGFLNAKLLVEILKKVGPEPKRERIKEAVESIRGLDLGIDRSGLASKTNPAQAGEPAEVRVSFSPQRHQGLDQVYFTLVVDGRFVPLTDEGWKRWRR
jgi:branched-chain amino acid transport system substrate-binding protein